MIKALTRQAHIARQSARRMAVNCRAGARHRRGRYLCRRATPGAASAAIRIRYTNARRGIFCQASCAARAAAPACRHSAPTDPAAGVSVPPALPSAAPAPTRARSTLTPWNTPYLRGSRPSCARRPSLPNSCRTYHAERARLAAHAGRDRDRLERRLAEIEKEATSSR